MEIAVLVGRLLLGGVFAVAGLAKLADRAGTRQAVSDFGAPRFLAAPLAILLPLAELAVAVALVPKASAWWGAIGALALLLVFVAAIGVSIARGRAPDCRCFGQLQSSPAGWRTLGRNGVLAAVAAFVVVQGRDDPGLSAVAWLGDLGGVELAGLIGAAVVLSLLALEAVLLFNLLRQNGRIVLRLDALEARLGTTDTSVEAPAAPPEPQPGLPLGTQAPGFQLSGLYGETLTLDALRAAGKPVMLLFGDPNCGPCNALLPEVGRWQRAYAAELTLAVVSRGSVEENRAKSTEHGITNVLLQQDREVAEAYLENGTPAAVIVRPDGTVGSPLAAGADAISALVARTVGSEAAVQVAAPAPQPHVHSGNGDGGNVAAGPPAPVIGDPVPPVRLRDINGRNVNLAGFRGTRTVVLFWNPGCGFCSQILDDLKQWEADPPAGAPKLVVVSTGDAEANRAMGLRSPVLLEPAFEVGYSFGANGTPSAILVDEEGRIGSQLAVGGPAVLGLLGAAESASTNGAGPTGAQVGEPAPPVELQDADGRTIRLADYRGRETLLLFWNPGCGFCGQMLDDLRAWDANRPPGAPELLLISAGSAEAAREMRLRSPVLLDPRFEAGRAFGANGTPMAVLIDEHGRVASDVVGGAPAVLELAGAPQGAADANASS